MWRDLATLGLIVALFALAGWLLPRCSMDLTRPPAPTTTTDYRRASLDERFQVQTGETLGADEALDVIVEAHERQDVRLEPLAAPVACRRRLLVGVRHERAR